MSIVAENEISRNPLTLQKRSGVVLDGKSSTRQIRLLKIPALSADDEARAFWDCIKKRRGEDSSLMFL